MTNRGRGWWVEAALAAGVPAIAWLAMPAGSQPVRGEAGVTGWRRELTAEEAAMPWPPPPGPGEVEGTMLATIVPVPGGVAIGATATIHDVGPDVPPLVWSVEVRDGQDRGTVFEHTYHEQAFRIPAGEEARPTFTDRIALPPGDYFVLVRLSSAADRIDQDGQLERAGMLVSDGDRVTVPAE